MAEIQNPDRFNTRILFELPSRNNYVWWYGKCAVSNLSWDCTTQFSSLGEHFMFMVDKAHPHRNDFVNKNNPLTCWNGNTCCA